MRILTIGDVVGRPGREAVEALLPGLREELQLDLVVANGENSAGGFGITPKTAEQLLSYGVDVITTGNHVWDQKEIIPHLDSALPVLRPLNYPATSPGRGYYRTRDALIVNLIGRVFVGTFDCPFRAMDSLLAELSECPKVIVIDLHAEATSEKSAMGWYLDGRVSAVVGTHTHVATADARVLPGGDGICKRSGDGRPSQLGHRRQEGGRFGAISGANAAASAGRDRWSNALQQRSHRGGREDRPSDRHCKGGQGAGLT